MMMRAIVYLKFRRAREYERPLMRKRVENSQSLWKRNLIRQNALVNPRVCLAQAKKQRVLPKLRRKLAKANKKWIRYKTCRI